MARKYEGVGEANGKCYIRWYEGKRRKGKALNINYTAPGIKRAAKIRDLIIKAIDLGEKDRGECPTFRKMAQTRLNTAKLKPETRRTQKIYLNKYWVPYFGDDPIEAIHYDDILDIMQEPMARLAPKTMKHILSAGSMVFRLAIKSRWITDNPALLLAEEVKLEKRLIDPFTREERDQILDAFDGHQHLFYAIRFYTGMRPAEVVALRWSDCANGCFKVTKARIRGKEGTTKNGVERLVPIHPYIQELLVKTPRHIRNDHIIINREHRHYQSADKLSQAFVSRLRLLGIRYRSPYNCRHTAATMMLEAGMKPGYCAQILGHSTEMFFRVYAGEIDKGEAEKQAQLWADFA